MKPGHLAERQRGRPSDAAFQHEDAVSDKHRPLGSAATVDAPRSSRANARRNKATTPTDRDRREARDNCRAAPRLAVFVPPRMRAREHGGRPIAAHARMMVDVLAKQHHRQGTDHLCARVSAYPAAAPAHTTAGIRRRRTAGSSRRQDHERNGVANRVTTAPALTASTRAAESLLGAPMSANQPTTDHF